MLIYENIMVGEIKFISYADGCLYCAFYDGYGYDDWFLPSTKDLSIILKGRWPSGVYWTSDDKIPAIDQYNYKPHYDGDGWGVVYNNNEPYRKIMYRKEQNEYQVMPVRYIK
jgi:hypothetical protein